MNDQQVFDAALAHARQQGRRSLMPTGSCAYRGEDGTKCFIGALITDEAYEWRLECQGASSDEVRAALAASGVIVETTEEMVFCSRLQTIHDGSGMSGFSGDTPQQWEENFRATARQYDLTYTPPGN